MFHCVHRGSEKGTSDCYTKTNKTGLQPVSKPVEEEVGFFVRTLKEG